jgi:hypothetical protein
MPVVILRVLITNDGEFNITQQLLFLMGYKWWYYGKEPLVFRNRINYLCLWSDGEVSIDKTRPLVDEEKYLNFKEFIDYIEENDIKYERF